MVQYIFKFKKKTAKEVEEMMLQTLGSFELYIPHEGSDLKYVVGSVDSELQINNLKNYFEINKEDLIKATNEELNEMIQLVGSECGRMATYSKL